MSQNNKFKFMPDEEEIERQRKEILFEMNKANDEIRKDKKKRILIIISIITVCIFLIKIIFGEIDIPNIFKYPENKNRYYKVTLNGELISSEYFLKQRIPIIPNLIYLKRETYGTNIVSEDSNGSYYEGDSLDNFIIDIDSYSCYYRGYQTMCKDEKQSMEKNNDTEYSRLVIWKKTKPVEKLYDGEFINDITPYIKEKKGVYGVEIHVNYSFIETNVTFSIRFGKK